MRLKATVQKMHGKRNGSSESSFTVHGQCYTKSRGEFKQIVQCQVIFPIYFLVWIRAPRWVWHWFFFVNHHLPRRQHVTRLTMYLFRKSLSLWRSALSINEPWHEISNNAVCATSKGSDQPAHTRSLIRAFASRLNIQWLLNYWLNMIRSF